MPAAKSSASRWTSLGSGGTFDLPALEAISRQILFYLPFAVIVLFQAEIRRTGADGVESVSFYDTEGNRVSMLKALPRMAVRPKSQ